MVRRASTKSKKKKTPECRPQRFFDYTLVLMNVILIVFILRFLSERSEYKKKHNGINSSIVFKTGGVSSRIDKTKGLMRMPFCQTTKRCRPMDIAKSFSFVHVAKCAGASLIHELAELLPHFRPRIEGGVDVEHPVAYQRKHLPGYYILTTMKSPRHHVWSMFTECKYSAFGKSVTEGTNFPRSGDSPESDVKDFRKWLRHFAKEWPYATDDCFWCYDPNNFQSHHFTSNRESQHCFPESPSPDRELANQTYWNLDWVGLADLYHESKCLLFHRILSSTTTESTQQQQQQQQQQQRLQDGVLEGSNVVVVDKSLQKMRAYVDEECTCPRTKFSDVTITHHARGHRSDLRDLPQDILETVEEMSRVDAEMYRMALDQMLKEVVWMENLEVERRVLCDDVLHKLEPKLEYLGINVTARYYEFAESHKPA